MYEGFIPYTSKILQILPIHPKKTPNTVPPEVWCFRQVMRVQTSSFFGGGPGCHPGYPSVPWGENAEETTDPMSCRYRSFHQDLGKSNLEEAATGLPSGKLTWLAGKWTLIEDVGTLLKMGDFPASHVSLLEGMFCFFCFGVCVKENEMITLYLNI